MFYSIVRRRRRPNASLLAEAVRTIGKRRFEIRQQVSCPLEDRKLHYLVETWFFFPQSLQINRWSYTATDYQQSLKNYIRLGVPIRPLESLLGGELPPPLRKLEAEEGGGEEIIELTLPEQFPDILEDCSRRLDDLLWQNTPETRERYEDSLKLFCIAFRVSLLARKNAVLAIEDGSERTRAAYDLTRLAVACLKRYRKLLGKRAKAARNLLRAPAFLYCDEYLSIITTRTLGEIVRRLSPVHKCSTYILACFGAQRAYRRSCYPESMPSKTGDNELPVFRWSVLKKYVDMPLFLNVQRHSGNSLLEHVLYSLIAAVAMSLALTVTLLWEGAGSLSAPIFVIAVFAYICRERIKDVLKHKLFKVFGKWIPDRVLRVCDGYGRRLGHCAEQFRFADWDKLPKEVRVLRNRTHFVDILNAFHNEDILYYSKRIDIKELPDPFHEGKNLLLDISRFDISDFLRHADEVLDEPQGGMDDVVGGDKVYHVDMVRKITHRCGSDLERFRIVLTHAGIRRIDEIKPLFITTGDNYH